MTALFQLHGDPDSENPANPPIASAVTTVLRSAIPATITSVRPTSAALGSVIGRRRATSAAHVMTGYPQP